MSARRALLLVLALQAGAAPALEPSEVAVVANRRLTNSVALARHYLQARGIPERNLVLLDLPEGEDLARGHYETHLRDPLLEQWRARGLVEQVRRPAGAAEEGSSGWQTVRSSLRAVVCLHGVPLRIAPRQSRLLERAARVLRSPVQGDGAAVDSELALLLADPYTLAGRIVNPAYQLPGWSDLGEGRHQLLMATRLDAADAATVRRMIDDAVAVESNGLDGRLYFDLRAARDDSYSLGDLWLEEAHERLAREGFECVVDRHDGIFGAAYPMETPAGYFGWYTEQVTGPFRRADFRFARGAIAYPLHSASAQSLRDPTRYWVAPLLAAGACVTLGATDEPLLGLTPNLQVLVDRLARGRCFGEAALLALPALSWHITVVGDPLYRPWARPLDQQLQRPDDGQADGDWIIVRQANRLVRAGRYNAALDGLRRRVRERDSPLLREKLGDLYAAGDLPRESAESYLAGLALAPTAEYAVRVLAKAQAALRISAQEERARAAEAQVRERWAGHECLNALNPGRP